MDNIYLLMLIAIIVLAVADIIVGVSNDAINFLNSAIGSKAISLRTIMIVASLGIFIGAVFSSGMMEVARKGIFVPAQFQFGEIMLIFMAVMITDILLLDFFNTLGMPTSTTVSIVFNLLGAAVVMSLIKISGSDTQTFADLGSDVLTVHFEACTHLHRTLQAIKAAGMKAGVALNPHTNVSLLEDVIQDIDLVCVMSVNPGFGGQKFIYQTIPKVRQLRTLIDTRNTGTQIEIDGVMVLPE